MRRPSTTPVLDCMAQTNGKDVAKVASLSFATAGGSRVELPRTVLAHFSQPEVHMSIKTAARVLGFAGDQELLRFAKPLLKQSEEEPLGSHVGALMFKRLVALCAAKQQEARKLLEDILTSTDTVNLPAHPVPKRGQLTRWPGSVPEEVGMEAAPFERLHHYFEWRTRMRHFAGVACGVVKNGKLVYYQESGYSNVEAKTKMSGDTLVRLFSMTKCLVSAAFMTFCEETARGIDLDDPVSKYIPAFAASQMSVLPKRGQKESQPLERAITLRQLLTHTSGIGYGATLDDPWPPQKGSYYKIYEELCEKTKAGTITNLEDWCNTLAKVPLKGQPGHFWDYSYSLDVLGRVVEVISGKTLDVALEERICGPLKMRDTNFAVPKDQAHRIGPWYKSVEIEGKPNLAHQLEVVDKGGEESGWVGANVAQVLSGGGTVDVPLVMRGGMVSTFNDYLRFLMMLRSCGELDGVRILKRETVQLMTSNHIPASCSGKKTVFVFDKAGVGYNLLGQIQAAHPKQDKGTYSGEYGWGGLAGPAWTIDPRSDLVVLSMTQTAFVLDHEEYLRYAGRRAVHQYVYGTVAAPAKATSHPPEAFDAKMKAPGDASKEEQDKEFEEEYKQSRLTRARTAKERAILPGARLDRHPSDEAEAVLSAIGGGGPGGAGALDEEPEATPAAKRRKSNPNLSFIQAGESASPPGANGSKTSGQVAGGKSPTAKQPQEQQQRLMLPPGSVDFSSFSKLEDLLYMRVAVPFEADESSPSKSAASSGVGTPMAQKARVTAVNGDEMEVITEGSWATRSVKLADVSVIDESQFGIPNVRPSDPMDFPAPKLPAKESFSP